MNDTLLALVSVAVGVALKAAWSAWIDKQKAIELETWKLQVSQLEKRLSQFYWPIYIRLQRDNVVWQKILDRENKSDTARRKLAIQIEEGVLLPNHEEIVKAIESNIHLAALDEEFEAQVLAYLRHIDVYRSIRTVGIKVKTQSISASHIRTAFLPQSKNDSTGISMNMTSYFDPKVSANPAVDPVCFALWTLRDEAAQRRSHSTLGV